MFVNPRFQPVIGVKVSLPESIAWVCSGYESFH
jgi:hypothetical protein